ncbi:hypothetical protein Syun_020731 [Stephania yunnanensis]|uniref:Uncharacterized protein n=1 Tax=Stephania yunnanensis TaxID=152371 RepID=A0AAP0NPZ0_9MAGN
MQNLVSPSLLDFRVGGSPESLLFLRRRILLVTRIVAWCRADYRIAILEARLTLAALAGPPPHRAFTPSALSASTPKSQLFVAYAIAPPLHFRYFTSVHIRSDPPLPLVLIHTRSTAAVAGHHTQSAS